MVAGSTPVVTAPSSEHVNVQGRHAEASGRTISATSTEAGRLMPDGKKLGGHRTTVLVNEGGQWRTAPHTCTLDP